MIVCLLNFVGREEAGRLIEMPIPKMYHIFCFFYFVMCSCKPSGETKSQAKKVMTEPLPDISVCNLTYKNPGEVYGFNYLNIERLSNEISKKIPRKSGEFINISLDEYKSAYLNGVMARAKELNATDEPMQPDRNAGGGIYLADNPWDSRGFGNLLTIIRFRPSGIYCSTIPKLNTRGKMTNKLIKSPDKAIVYGFGNFLSQKSLVVRDASFFNDAKITLAYVGDFAVVPEKMKGINNNVPFTPVFADGLDYKNMSIESALVRSVSAFEYVNQCKNNALMMADKDLEKACAPILNLKEKLDRGFDKFIPTE
jgi:hypothetical protein